LLGTVAVVALIAGPANAADLAVKAPIYKAAPPVVTYYSWTGCYVGGHVGGLWAKKDWTLAPPDPAFALGSHDANSWLGGVHKPGAEPQIPSIFEVFNTALDIVEQRVARSRLAGEPADVLITPLLPNFGTMEYHRAREAIAEGRAAVERMMPLIEQVIG